MKKYKLNTSYTKTLSDTVTPVGIFFRLRDRFPNSILLESSDYHGDDHSMSYFCVDPISKFTVQDGRINVNYPDGENSSQLIGERTEVIKALDAYARSFETDKLDFPFITEGVFGYSSYNSVRYFADVDIQEFKTEERKIPDMI